MSDDMAVTWEITEEVSKISIEFQGANLSITWGPGAEEAADALVAGLPQVLAAVAEKRNEEVQHG